MERLYNVVACTDGGCGLVGSWDVVVGEGLSRVDCQKLVSDNIGVYPGGVWYQHIDMVKLTEEEVTSRVKELVVG